MKAQADLLKYIVRDNADKSYGPGLKRMEIDENLGKSTRMVKPQREASLKKHLTVKTCD